MNVQDYISSGIVESYVLGLASPEEQSEFERMCRQYPEVLQARTNFELAMEEHAFQNAIAPPPAIKQQVMDALAPAEAKIIPLESSTRVTSTSWLKYAVAACFVVLAGSLYWNISQSTRNRKLQESYNALVKDYDSLSLHLAEVEDEIDMLISNPNIKMAAMKGQKISPLSFATVFWDTTTNDVYLQVNNLPTPPSDKQYQLWALFNGQPIDMGMIDNDVFTGEKKLLLQMKNVKGAQAFAITLEKKGGNPTPQGDMYTLGNL